MNRNETIVVLASFILTLVVISLAISFMRYPTITGFITYNPDTNACAYNSSHPYYPDWNITPDEDCTVSSGTIFLQGNLDVYGNLTLSNVKLILNITSDGQRNIRVYSGGSLNITGGSNITTNNTNLETNLNANPGSIFEMRDSYLNEFIDISVLTDNAVIDNNTFTYNVDQLQIVGSNNSIISNNTFFQTTGGIYLDASNFSTVYNNNISHDVGSSESILVNNNAHNNTISKNWISNVYRGILFQDTTNNTVFANTIQYCSGWTLALLGLADGNNITNNTITQGSFMAGVYVWGGAGNTIEKNIISYNVGPGVSLLNYVGGESPRFNKIIGNEIYNNTGSGIQANTLSSGILIENNTVYKNDDHGISSTAQDNVTIQYNTIYDNDDTFGIESAGKNQTIVYNIINDSEYGIYSEALHSNISNNTVYNTTNGIYLGWMEYSNITNNIVYSNVYGIVDYEAINSTITRNTVKNNTVYGILLTNSDYPNVTYNKICYNAQGLSNDTITNIIDNNEFCVNLLTPTNGASVSSISNFTFNVSNPLFTSSCQVYINGVMRAANSSVINHAESTILYSGSVSAGTNYWYVYCNDSTATNWANSSIFSFIGPICGDGTCNGDEDCTSCPADCGACGGGSSPAPVETPPVETPPVQEPPPSETPPFETPPVETPPVKQEPQDFVYDVVNEGSSMVMTVEAKGPVEKVSVNPSSDASNVIISVGKGTEITCETLNIQQNSKIAYDGKEKLVYTCFDISKQNLDDEDIKDVEILFKVDKKWIIVKNIDIPSVELLRHHSNKWNPLTTEQVEKSDDLTGSAVLESGEELEEDYFYFKATSPGLTPFVIAGLQIEPPKDCYIWIIPCWMFIWLIRISLVGLILVIIYEKRKH